MSAPRPRRSALFLPASNPRALAKARTLACDCVILDLEDAVAPEAKDAARAAAVAAVREGGFGGRELVIRINAPDSDWGPADLDAVAAAAPDAVLLPKLAETATLARARGVLGDGVPLWGMIETARGVLALAELADAAPAHDLVVLVAGTNDLALDLRCRPGVDRAPLLPALAQIVLAARAYGLAALDGVCNAIDEPDRLEAECRQGLAWGFDGKTLIHPAQVEVATRVFTPGEAEIARARAIVDAFADPGHAGRGAIRLAGAMVERLHLAEAERVLAIAARIEERPRSAADAAPLGIGAGPG